MISYIPCYFWISSAGNSSGALKAPVPKEMRNYKIREEPKLPCARLSTSYSTWNIIPMKAQNLNMWQGTAMTSCKQSLKFRELERRASASDLETWCCPHTNKKNLTSLPREKWQKLEMLSWRQTPAFIKINIIIRAQSVYLERCVKTQIGHLKIPLATHSLSRADKYAEASICGRAAWHRTLITHWGFKEYHYNAEFENLRKQYHIRIKILLFQKRKAKYHVPHSPILMSDRESSPRKSMRDNSQWISRPMIIKMNPSCISASLPTSSTVLAFHQSL